MSDAAVPVAVSMTVTRTMASDGDVRGCANPRSGQVLIAMSRRHEPNVFIDDRFGLTGGLTSST
jgi:hypothetical protein